MENTTIRTLKTKDLTRISRIIEKTLGKIDTKKAKKDLLDQSKNLYADGEDFVAEVNKKVVGVIGYWRLSHHPKNVVQLDWFAVDKKYQRQGIGSQLLLFLINRLRKKNIHLLCCERSSKDISSKAFYKKHKFKEFGRMKNYWEDGGDLVLLSRQLHQKESQPL